MSRAFQTILHPWDIANLKFDFNANALAFGSDIIKDGSDRVERWANSAPGITTECNQTTAANKPTWTDSLQNGKPGIVLDQSLTQYLVTDAFAPTIVGKENDLGFTNFAVVKHATGDPNITGAETVFAQRRGTGNNSFAIRANHNATNGDPWQGQVRRLATTPEQLDQEPIANISFQSTSGTGAIIRVTFESAVGLAGVAANDVIRLEGSTNSINNGQFRITAVDNGADTIDYFHPFRTSSADDETGSPAVCDVWDNSNTNSVDSTGDIINSVVDTSTHIICHSVYAGRGNRVSMLGQLMMDDLGVVGQNTTTTSDLVNISDPEEFWIGARNGTNEVFDGTIFQMLGYDRPLTSWEAGHVMFWLNLYWGTGFNLKV